MMSNEGKKYDRDQLGSFVPRRSGSPLGIVRVPAPAIQRQTYRPRSIPTLLIILGSMNCALLLFMLSDFLSFGLLADAAVSFLFILWVGAILRLFSSKGEIPLADRTILKRALYLSTTATIIIFLAHTPFAKGAYAGAQTFLPSHFYIPSKVYLGGVLVLSLLWVRAAFKKASRLKRENTNNPSFKPSRAGRIFSSSLTVSALCVIINPPPSQKWESYSLDQCRQNLLCMGESYAMEKSAYCEIAAQHLAKNQYRWSRSIENIDFFKWADQRSGQITMIGSGLEFQNGFGVWVPMNFTCDYDPDHETISNVHAYER